MKVALVGLQQSGKSTLLSAISGKAAVPSGSAHIEEAVVPVPDPRLDWLTKLYQPKKTVQATIDCLDLPGFSFIDESGRAGARRLISQIKTVDMFVMVVQGFSAEGVGAYRGSLDPLRDIRELQSEFLLSDLELVTTRIDRLEKQVTKATKTQQQDKAELALQLKLQEALEAEKPAHTAIKDDSELEIIKSLGLLTLKPFMVVINTGEENPTKGYDISGVVDQSVPVISLSAKLEQELIQLDQASREEFMKDLGIQETAGARFVKSCYTALGLISFLTVGPDEVRAWPIKAETTALDAAGKIHTDIKRGFIRAETMAYADLHELGEEKAVKAAGKMRLEGKTYIVQDGDIINFRFNV